MDVKRIKFYDLKYPVGQRVRVIDNNIGDIPKTLLDKCGKVREINYKVTEESGVLCYDIVMDNRKRAKVMRHDDIEKVVE